VVAAAIAAGCCAFLAPGCPAAAQELYCQHCAFKNGLCTMCGKKVMDTSMYTSGQLWDGSEEVVKNVIAKVDEEQRQAKKRKKGRGGIAGAAAASAAKSAAADADAAITQANIFPAETDGGGSDDRAASIDVTFGKEGGLGIAFTDEGWEIREILEGGALRNVTSPPLCSALRSPLVGAPAVIHCPRCPRWPCAQFEGCLALRVDRCRSRDGGPPAGAVPHPHPRSANPSGV
jgi:hypothetical protein